MSHLAETLSTARRTHTVLTLAAVAVIVAAAPVGPDHGEALSEVQALRELGSVWLPGYCLGLTLPEYQPLGRWVREAHDVPFAEVHGPATCPLPEPDASLETYYSLLRGSFFVDALVPDSAGLVEAVAGVPAGALLDVYVGGEAEPRVVRRFADVDSVSIDAVWNLTGPDRPRRSGRIEARIGARSRRVAHPRDLVRSLEEVVTVNSLVIGGSMERGGVVRDPSGLEPLRGPGEFATGEAIPTLRSMWTEVQDMSLDEAAAYLRAQAAEGRGGVEVFGLGIDLDILALGGPTVLVFLLAHLLLHVRHLERIGGEESTTFRRFPWAPLFPDRAARLVTLLTVWVVPVTAGLIVTWRVMDAGLYAMAFAGGGTLIVTSLGWRVLRELSQVRGRSIEAGPEEAT